MTILLQSVMLCSWNSSAECWHRGNGVKKKFFLKKDGITVALGSRATRTNKLQVFVIGKSANLRTLEKYTLYTF